MYSTRILGTHIRLTFASCQMEKFATHLLPFVSYCCAHQGFIKNRGWGQTTQYAFLTIFKIILSATPITHLQNNYTTGVLSFLKRKMAALDANLPAGTQSDSLNLRPS